MDNQLALQSPSPQLRDIDLLGITNRTFLEVLGCQHPFVLFYADIIVGLMI
jgi:hypothetical protein